MRRSQKNVGRGEEAVASPLTSLRSHSIDHEEPGPSQPSLKRKSSRLDESREVKKGKESGSVNFPFKEMVSYLDHHDLQVCRLVHPRWNELASKELISRAVFGVQLKFSRKLGYFVEKCQWKLNEKEAKSLEELNQLVSDPNCNFPCTNFDFEGGDLGSEEVEEFFELFGSNIKTLKIHREPMSGRSGLKFHELDYTEKKTLARILSEKCVNVEYLTIGYFDFDWDDDEKIDLQNVKELTCDFPKKFQFKSKFPPKSTAFSMLRTAPKLELVKNFKVDYIDWFVAQGKLHTIQSYNLEIYFGCEEKLTQFAATKPRLQSLDILFKYHLGRVDEKFKDLELSSKRVKFLSSILNSIFHSSRYSLTSLIMTPLELFGKNRVNLPEFPNLIELTIQNSNAETVKSPSHFKMMAPICSNICDLQQTFPSLTILNLYMSTNKSDRLPLYFQDKNGDDKGHLDLPTVKTLRLGAHVTKRWCHYLSDCLPNIKTLALTAESQCAWVRLDQCVQNICAFFPDIENFQILGCDKSLEFKGTTLDSVLTGIPKKRVWALRGCQATFEVETLKESLGVTDLKNLKRLDINICNETWQDDGKPFTFNLMSHVCRIYAFDLMPETKVNIGYNMFCPSAEKIDYYLKAVECSSVTFVNKNYEDYF